MKKLLLILAITLFTFVLKAQNAGPAAPKTSDKKLEKTETNYCCTKCDYCDIKAGKCPTHENYLLKEGNYYCDVCNTRCEMICICSKCGELMKEIKCKKK